MTTKRLIKLTKNEKSLFVQSNSGYIVTNTIQQIKEIKTRILDYSELTLSEKQLILRDIQKEVSKRLRITANKHLEA